MALILNTSKCSLEQLLTGMLNIPSLPEDWIATFSVNTAQAQDLDAPEPETPGDSERPSVGIPPEKVTQIRSIVRASDNGQIHSRIDEFQTSRMEARDSNSVNITKILNASSGGTSGSPGRHRSTSSTSGERIQSRSSVSSIEFEEDDLQKRMRNRTIGFAGELFV